MRRLDFAPSVLVILSIIPTCVWSHGRLIEPPSRSTMWRYGFSTPPNYNDHELYCGGFSRQWRTNGGKCGICGDPWDSPQPRANEAGGLYGKGIISRKYLKNQVIKIRVELTANHMGYFQFRICPNNNPAKAASQICLDKHLLRDAVTGDPNYYPGPGSKVFEVHYQLPKEVTCKQCVFQWRYVAGNNWGVCKNGTGAVGCGPQEEFRACADVAITDNDGEADNTPNTLTDPEIYIEDKDNEIDYVEEKEREEELEREVVEFESVVVVALASLLLTAFFFATLFFYYVRGGRHWLRRVFENGRRLKPNGSRLNYGSMVGWPPMADHLKKLPNLFTEKKPKETSKRSKRTDLISAPINIVGSTNLAATGPVTAGPSYTSKPLPRAPPRAKKAPLPPPETRIATITSGRPHAPRPVAPPPPVLLPSSSSSSSSSSYDTSSISGGESVTVNGISVRREPLEYVARPAVVDSDMPDSMETKSPPPPLPNCPPPEFDD